MSTGFRDNAVFYALMVLFSVFIVTSLSAYQLPKYEATAVVLVGQKGTAEPSQELARTAAKMVPTMPVAQAVVEQLNLPKGSAGKVLENMSVEHEPGEAPPLIDISYEDSDPKRAQVIANAIGRVASQKLPEVSPDKDAITATVWQPATLPSNPVSPKPLRNGLIALAIGLVLVAVRELLRR
jgi:capsular polysaccharide biosynthesis protein